MTSVEPGFPRLKPEVVVVEKTPMQRQGKRNRDAGMRFQRKARKAVEKLTKTVASRFRGQLGNEESWFGLPWRIECKYGLTNHPVVTLYEKARAQSEQNHAIGDGRPFVFVCGTARSRILAVVELEQDLLLVADSLMEDA